MGARAAGVMDWRSAMVLGRVSNLPTVWSNLLAGTLLAGGRPDGAAFPLLLVAGSLFYVGGMYLNDAFDRHVDARERPGRPIPSGRVGARTVFVLGFGMLAAGVALAAPAGFPALAAAVALVAAIIAYDVHHKGNRFSPVVMGLCRALVYAVAGLAASTAPPAGLAVAALGLLAYVAGLTYAARQENLAEFKGSWPLALLAAPVALAAGLAEAAALPFLALFSLWLGYGLSRLLMRRWCDVKAAVGAMIAGISLLDAVWVAHAGGPVLALAAVGAFALTLAAQRKVPGT